MCRAIQKCRAYFSLDREVATLVNRQQPKGDYEIEFDATGLTSGVYFYKIQVGNDFVDTKKMILLR